MIRATTLKSADSLALQRTIPQSSTSISSPQKQSKVLTCAVIPYPTQPVRSPSPPPRPNLSQWYQPWDIRYTSSYTPPRHHFQLFLNAVLHVSDTVNITKNATTLHNFSTTTNTPTIPHITALTSTTTNSTTAYLLFPLSVQTQSQRTHTHPFRVGYQSYSTLSLRDPFLPITIANPPSFLSCFLSVSFCGCSEPPGRTFEDFSTERMSAA